MKRIKILSRRNVLERKEKQLEKKLSKVKKELEELTQKCKHEIVIQSKENESMSGKEQYCLFCKKGYPISKGIIIKMEEYHLLNEEMAEKTYKGIREEFPEDTELEIARKLVDKLNEYKN